MPRSKWKRPGSLFMVLLAVVMVAVAPGSGWATSYTFSPVDDSFVWSRDPNANYGNWQTLEASANSSIGSKIRTFLEFNISSIPNTEVITGGTLNLFNIVSSGSAPFMMDIHAALANFSEGTITWNNQPLLGAVITPFSSNGTANTWSQANLPAPALANAVFSLGILLQNESSVTKQIAFASKENSTTTSRPYLTVETTPVPLPGGALLLGGGLLRFYAAWRRRRD